MEPQIHALVTSMFADELGAMSLRISYFSNYTHMSAMSPYFMPHPNNKPPSPS